MRTAARKSAELFWAELYVPRSSFHWAVNQFQRSELLVLFLFCCALRQWRRGNIALMTTLTALGCLNLVQHLQPRCLEDRFLLNKQGKPSITRARLLQETHSSPLKGVHLLAEEIHRKMTAQRCRLQGNCPQTYPARLGPQRPRRCSKHCAHLPRQRVLCRPHRQKRGEKAVLLVRRHAFHHAKSMSRQTPMASQFARC